MITPEEEIPVIWRKPHNSSNLLYIHALSLLLDKFIKRYRKRLDIADVMIDLETPKNASGKLNKTFLIKLHLKLKDGTILIAESQKRTIASAMSNITKEIDNQSRSTDREKHYDTSRKLGAN